MSSLVIPTLLSLSFSLTLTTLIIMFNKLKDKLAEAASGPAGNAGGNAGGNIAANQPKQLGASKWAEFRLMPPPAMPLSASAVKQLQQVCDSLLGSETFSVTNSPVLCCEGKNYLYSQRPYWWETQPGCWGESPGPQAAAVC